MLDYHDGRFDLSLNSYNVPEVKVNRRYVEMIRGMVASDGTVRQEDREAIQFVKNKIDSAKWFISAIKQRHDTLMRTMQEILDYQREYFRDGDKSKLRPMILKDIADRTGLDVSTISRVVNSKYVQTHFGIILLKSLFSEAMQTESGEEVSSYEIKTLLQRCIDDEDKRRPLTENPMDMLNDRGTASPAARWPSTARCWAFPSPACANRSDDSDDEQLRSEPKSVSDTRPLPAGAHGVSWLLHPFFVPLYMMLVLLFTRTVFSHYALGVKIYLVWVVVLFTLVLPALSLVVLRALGRLADYRIDRRRDRYLPLALGALFYLLCALTLVKVPRLSCCARSWWPPPAAKSSACW